MDGSLHDVAQGCHMGEEVEPLEHHANPGPLAGDGLVVQSLEDRTMRRLHLPVSGELPIDVDFTGGPGLQLIDHPQKGGLARPRRAQDGGHRARHDLQADSLEHMKVTEGLVHVPDDDGRL